MTPLNTSTFKLSTVQQLHYTPPRDNQHLSSRLESDSCITILVSLGLLAAHLDGGHLKVDTTSLVPSCCCADLVNAGSLFTWTSQPIRALIPNHCVSLSGRESLYASEALLGSRWRNTLRLTSSHESKCAVSIYICCLASRNCDVLRSKPC